MRKGLYMTSNTPNNFERDAIFNIQTYLRHLSFHDERLASPGGIPLDGIWDSATKNSLIEFQKSRGLPVTGSVDRATWELLKQEYDASVAQNSPPVSLALFPRYPSGFVIKQGDRGYLAFTVQHILRELERLYYFGGISLDTDGIYGEKTAALIKDFQKRNSIPVTGNVDRETWDAMAIQYNLLLEYEE